MISINAVNAPFYPICQWNNSIHLELGVIFSEWSEITQNSIERFIRNFNNIGESLAPVAARLNQVKSVRHDIEELARLKENWDGYGASSISQKACGNALRFISLIEATPYGVPIPEISPTPSGTISFEWETSHAEAYLEIGNTRYSGFITIGQQQTATFEGQTNFLDQQIEIVDLLQRTMSLTPAYPASITEISIQIPRHEYLAP